ncbi:PilX N-terminal domain-containing pilus assembly protein [Rhodanobacter sp. PCA2]|uniref:pilus assembly PilX family protein n=1 Tax=Rhodanobacter sp. PCA2 TaxID=2006117 RepID=UPI0015E70694|nr:PilX N-terminal domain-containing pilus assembly protein [Rhodanobacter sp. PCA2]
MPSHRRPSMRSGVPGIAARAQRGAVLVIALIFLLLITMLAISASSRSLLQERMVGGLRNAQLAEMGAEAALRGAEWRLWSAAGNGGGVNCGTTVITECYIHDPQSPVNNVTAFRNGNGWITEGSVEYKGSSGSFALNDMSGSTLISADQRKLAKLAENPRYIIEDLGPEQPLGGGSAHESGVTSSLDSGPGNVSKHIYRITARSTGGSENTVRALESTFAAKSN